MSEKPKEFECKVCGEQRTSDAHKCSIPSYDFYTDYQNPTMEAQDDGDGDYVDVEDLPDIRRTQRVIGRYEERAEIVKAFRSTTKEGYRITLENEGVAVTLEKAGCSVTDTILDALASDRVDRDRITADYIERGGHAEAPTSGS